MSTFHLFKSADGCKEQYCVFICSFSSCREQYMFTYRVILNLKGHKNTKEKNGALKTLCEALI